MPIEDIDFLGQNCEVESTLFFLDSSSRDRSCFPTPSQFAVQFSEPIKLVIGVDILDATIPSAMYVVDWNNDSFVVTTLDASSDLGAGVEAQSLLASMVASSQSFASAMSNSLLDIYCQFVDATTGQIEELSAFETSNVPDAILYMIVVRQSGVAYPFSTLASMQRAVTSTMVSPVLALRKAVVSLQHGNYDVSSLLTQTNLCLLAVNTGITPMDYTFGHFSVVSPSSSPVTLQGRYAFTNDSKPFLFDMDPLVSPACTVFGFDTYPVTQNKTNGYSTIPQCFRCFGSVSASSVHTSTLSNPTITADVNIVVAPGIVNLLGVRYITLRCPEIEQHLYSGMSYGSHSTGLGVFKLPTGSDNISNLRFDFVSIVRKPFHPIGRLSRLTLSFEISDGVLYDFKGINTQMLITVKFLSPGKRVPIKQSILNPDYDPDFLRYTCRRLQGLSGLPKASGLLPVTPLYQDADDCNDVEMTDPMIPDVSRRREIAQRLLSEQDKYNYPAAEDDLAWRTVA